MSDPLSHSLFQEYPPTELHQQGVERLIACYQNGLERIKAIYRQEVLEIESRNTQGRRATEVVRTKFKDFKQKKTRRKVVTKLPQIQQNISQASGSNSQADNLELPDDQTKIKKKRKQITPEEEKILGELLVYKEELPDLAINEALSRLLDLSDDWTKTKVKAAWRYRKNKI